MKAIWILAGTEFTLLGIAFLLFLLHVHPFFIIWLILAAIGVMAAIAAEIRKIQIFQKLLLEEKNRNKKREVHWDEKEEEQLRLLRRRMEYSALQSQINPHFLYNTLESIRSRALLDGNTEIASMTEILSRFFRYCISNGEKLIRIREELNHIKDYFYIQKYRFEDKMDMEIILEEKVLEDYYIPKMSLQPLVENSMIHGLEKIEENGKITIRLMKTEKKLLIIVEDNGAGMSNEQLKKLNQKMETGFLDASQKKKGHNGVALANVNSRVKITFGEEFGIRYRSVEGRGTQAILVIPLIDDFERVKYKDIFSIEE